MDGNITSEKLCWIGWEIWPYDGSLLTSNSSPYGDMCN